MWRHESWNRNKLPIRLGLCYKLMTEFIDTEASPVGWLLRGFLPVLLASTLFGTEHYGYVHSGKKPIPGATVTASLKS